MNTSETRAAIVAPIAYAVAKRYLGLDHDAQHVEIVETCEEVADELELATSSVIVPRACSITFHDAAATFTVPGIVVTLTSVVDGTGEPVAYTSTRNGTSETLTPSRAVTLPLVVTYEGGELRPLVRRLLKEMIAHKMRHKGDEDAEYPASVRRVIQQLTKIAL